MALINTRTKDEFNTHVINSNRVVLVDFWASWCGPCLAMAPILQNIASNMDKDVDVVKVDVEASADNGALAGQYGVQGIPNMQIFKQGKVVQQIIGMTPEVALVDDLKNNLK